LSIDNLDSERSNESIDFKIIYCFFVSPSSFFGAVKILQFLTLDVDVTKDYLYYILKIFNEPKTIIII